jgi:hypothetical protein
MIFIKMDAVSDDDIIRKLGKISISSSINFDMSEMSMIIDEIEKTKTSFEQKCINKIVDNFIIWFSKNSKHNFPKSKAAWINLIFNQFRQVRVFINAEVLFRNIKSDYSNLDVNIRIIMDQIVKFVNKPKNQKFSEEQLIKKISTFTFFKYSVESEKLYQELERRGIIRNTTLNVNKRKIDEDHNVDVHADDIMMFQHSNKKSRF